MTTTAIPVPAVRVPTAACVPPTVDNPGARLLSPESHRQIGVLQ